jgi:hypothetical protein
MDQGENAHRMKRHFLTVAAILSSLLALGVATSWVRSYTLYDHVGCGSALDAYRCSWNSYSASFPFTRWPPAIPAAASRAVLISDGKIFFQQAVHNQEALPATAMGGYGWSSDANVVPSFSYFHAVTGAMDGIGHWNVRQVTVRHWALVLLFALLPAAWLFAWRRPNRALSTMR